MALPSSITKITVSGSYVGVDGCAAAGSVTFTPSITAAADGTLLPVAPTRITLDSYGAFSEALAATDDPDWATSGFTYTVTERIDGAKTRTYSITVPAASPGGVLDLAEAVPVSDVAVVSPYLRAVDLGTVVETPAGAQAKASAAQVAAQAASAQRAANLSDLASKPAARSNLGLATARRSPLLTPVRPGTTMINAFQAGHGWVVTGAGSSDLNDTTDFVLGTQSAKFVTNTAAGNATLDSPTLAPVNLTGLMPRLLVKVEGQANQASLRFFAGDATFANFRNWNLGQPESSPLATYLKDGEWTWVTFNWGHASVTGTDPRAAVTRFRLSATSTAGTALTVHVGAVTFVPEQSRWPNGVVSICFDDGRASPFANAKPKLDAMGWSATEYPIVDRIGLGAAYATVAQLQQAYRYSGWEMGVHASTAARHDAGLPALTAAELEEEIAFCQDWLAANNLGNGEGIAWPLGLSTRTHEEAAAKVCGYGRGNVSTMRETWPPPLPMRIRSVAVSPSNSLAVIQGYVDVAKTSRAWLCLTFHEITTPGTNALEWSTANFVSLMDYIAGQGCAVLPVGDVLRNAGTIT